MRVLVVEDNLDIQANIAEFLEPEYILDFAYNGDHGLELALANDYDVIVLDLMLPRRDGIDLCKAYKNEANLQAPILMLTARDTLEDKEVGFAAGADDYLTKPFALRELKIRIDALAKRPKIKNASSLRYGELMFDPTDNIVSNGSSSRPLNNKEAIIFRLLIEAAPNAISSETIAYKIWGEDPPNSGALRTHVYNLRKILSSLETCCKIETDRSRGYRLKESSSDE
ncbi:MAG: response regulator transcription factor [Parasphingorhabdus sp.]